MCIIVRDRCETCSILTYSCATCDGDANKAGPRKDSGDASPRLLRLNWHEIIMMCMAADGEGCLIERSTSSDLPS